MRFLLTKLSHFFIFFLGLSVTAPSANIHNSEYLFLFLIFSSIWLPGCPHESLIEKRSSDDCVSFVLLQGNQDQNAQLKS